MTSDPCPHCGFVLIDDDEPHADCPGCGRAWHRAPLATELLASVLGSAPAMVDAAPDAQRSAESSRILSGLIAVLLLAGCVGLATLVGGIWPVPIRDTDWQAAVDSAAAERAVLTARVAQLESEVQEVRKSREAFAAQVAAVQRVLSAAQDRNRELERIHAESLQMLRDTQTERDALRDELQTLREEQSLMLAQGASSFVRRWQVLGPLTSPDSALRSSVERDPFRADLQVASMRGPVRWKLWESPEDRISLNRACESSSQHDECYLVGWIHVAVAARLQLSLGSDDGCCVWVNRERVLERRGLRAASPGQDRVQVDLPAGWTEILAHIDNSGGSDWAFYCELQSTDGQPLRLPQSPTPPRAKHAR